MRFSQQPVKPGLQYDLLVLGSGIAGLRAAVEAAQSGWTVLVATKDLLRESNTGYAQGGIAVALSSDDSVEAHVADTLMAGDGLCDERTVRVLAKDGPKRVTELMEWGAQFDRNGEHLHFTREAAHSRNRILHAGGDSTGRELERTLVAKAGATPSIRVLPYHMCLRLIIEEGRAAGAWLFDDLRQEPAAVLARSVIVATGGAGRLFQESTNPPIATGDGMAMALEAGALMANLEFVQFHPTALFLKNAPRFLLSESMRGEGAVLRNVRGERFMERYHPMGDLAPRDVVSRSIVREIKATMSSHVCLDLTGLDAAFVRQRFPMIFATCLQYGLDITTQPIPVHPAAHYIMGGIETDDDGRASIAGLYAAGEAACTGVHGANRLASNSLLEGLVFGARAGAAAVRDALPPPKTKAIEPPPFSRKGADLEIVNTLRRQVASLMWEGAGIVRTATGIEALRSELLQIRSLIGAGAYHRRAFETLNMALLGEAIASCAEYRTESRGGHYREDFPERDDARWKRPTRMRKLDGALEFLESNR